MQLFVTRGLGVEAPFVFAHHGQQLRVRVTPFAHAPHVDKVLSQQSFVFAVGEFVFLLSACAPLFQPLPQRQIPTEFAAVIVKLSVRLIGSGLRFHRSVTHILSAQGRGDHQYLFQSIALPRFQIHAAYARV